MYKRPTLATKQVARLAQNQRQEPTSGPHVTKEKACLVWLIRGSQSLVILL